MRKSTILGLATGVMMAMGLTANAANPSYTLNPASGSVVPDLMTISIDFTDTEVLFYENNRIPVAVLENKTTGAVYNCQDADIDSRAMTNGKAYTLTFINQDENEAEPITTAGSYELTVRSMYQIVDGENVDLDPITATYTIKYPANYTLNPAPGTASDLQGITINFTEDKVSFFENNRAPLVVLENTTTGKTYSCADPDRDTFAQTDGSAYKFMFVDYEDFTPEAINEPGNYVLTVKGMYTGEGEEIQDLPAIIANYTVNFPVDFTVDPAFGTTVTDLTNITLTFDDTTVAFYENNRMPVAVLENETTGTSYVCQDVMLDTRATGGKAYTLTFVNEENDDATPVTEPGYYALTVRGAYNEDGDLPVIMGNYFISYPVPYDLIPVADATVESISQVTLQFPENRNVKFYENNRMPVAVISNLNNGKEYTCQEADLNTFAQLENGMEYVFRFVDEAGESVIITEPGKYELAIRGIYQEVNDEIVDLPVITTTYTVPFPVDYVLYPENGANVGNLMTVAIDFPNNKVAFYENNRIPVAVLENLTTGKIYNAEEADRDTFAQTDGSAYTFTFIATDETEAMPITEPGQYQLTIRSMYQTVGEEDVTLPAITANYTVPFPVDYLLYPDNGASVQDLQGIVLQFPNNMVSFYEMNRMSVAVLENVNTGKVYNCQDADRNTRAELEGGVEYVLNFIGEDDEEAMPITEPGQYKLTVRGMYQTIDEEQVDLPVINASYTVPFPVAYNLNPDNGATVQDLQTVTIQFPENVVEFYESNKMSVAVLENTTTGKIYNAQDADRNTYATEGTEYTFTFIGENETEAMPITEPGKYQLTIRAMYQTIDEEPVDLPVINANYTIAYPVEYYLNPDNGAYVLDLQTVAIEFPENVVEFYENNKVSVAVLENLTTGAIYNAQEADRNTFAQTEGTAYTFTFIGEDEEEAMPITEPGQYQLTIRAMYQTVNDELVDLPVINANYTIAYPVEYVLVPENGATVENLKTVVIEFPFNKNVAFDENNRMPVAVLENLTTGAVYNAQDADRNTMAPTDGIEYSFTFIGEDEEEAMDITEPGKYQLTIRSMYLDNGEEEENVVLPVITANYTIAYPVEYVLDPDNGATVENLMTVNLIFPVNKNVVFDENNRTAVAVLVNNTTGAEYECQEPERNTFSTYEDGIEYSLTFIAVGEEEATPITDMGNYTLTIRNLSLVDEEGEGSVLPVIIANYRINYPVEYILTPADGDYVEQIDQIEIEFPYNNNVGFFGNMQVPVAVLTEVGTGHEYVCTEADRNTFAQTEGVAYTLKFMDFENESYDPITEKGTYKLVIRALALFNDEDEVTATLPVIEATYVIATSGVEAIEAIDKADVYNVYNMNGIQIVKNGKAEDVKNLGAGLYIINGQKVLIRK